MSIPLSCELRSLRLLRILANQRDLHIGEIPQIEFAREGERVQRFQLLVAQLSTPIEFGPAGSVLH
jgi:hypothetical protein